MNYSFTPVIVIFGSVSQKRKINHIIIDIQDSSCVAKDHFEKTKGGQKKILK